MKKIIFTLAIAVMGATFFTSCTSGIERTAKNEMENYVKSIAKNPSSITFDNVDVVVSNDTLVVIESTMRGQNSFGGMTISRQAYIYRRLELPDGIHPFQVLFELDKKSPFYNAYLKSCKTKNFDGFISAMGREVGTNKTVWQIFAEHLKF